jgi:site-specific DNA recombinase
LKYNLKVIDEKIEKIEEGYVIGEINGELYNKFVHKFKKEKEDT